jgi:hypothetical protein
MTIMTPPASFEAFEQASRAAGCDTVLERRWAPDVMLQTHTHDFAAEAWVVHGEMWLTHGGQTLHLTAGGHFKLDALVPHEERYGPEGAVLWVARRTVPGLAPSNQVA